MKRIKITRSKTKEEVIEQQTAKNLYLLESQKYNDGDYLVFGSKEEQFAKNKAGEGDTSKEKRLNDIEKRLNDVEKILTDKGGNK